MDAIEKLKATVVSLIEERNTLREDRDRLIEEAKDLMRERDDAREHADCEKQYADELKAERDELIQRLTTEQIMNAELQHEAELAREERDEARKCAEEIRDLCVGVFPFPWEAES